jgi:16S rRNA (cytidine1402-2'-O)-methyltransferase
MEKGHLYIIATPIGNLEDITLRALRILGEEVDILYCEDTRQTRKLLSHYDLKVELRSLHSHSPGKDLSRALAELEKGKILGYATDAGSPGVSDPGSRLVAGALALGARVTPLPGPSALTAILSVSPFPGREIHFSGFLSRKPGKRRKELEQLLSLEGSVVLYESPHRIDALLHEIGSLAPERELLLGRELTKIHEECIPGKASEISGSGFTRKGEIVLLIGPE